MAAGPDQQQGMAARAGVAAGPPGMLGVIGGVTAVTGGATVAWSGGY